MNFPSIRRAFASLTPQDLVIGYCLVQAGSCTGRALAWYRRERRLSNALADTDCTDEASIRHAIQSIRARDSTDEDSIRRAIRSLDQLETSDEASIYRAIASAIGL